jgi:YebC/PmpR family DNA-binding regulatory protein
MAGHSKWANIKHRKARQDSKRSKMWSKCARAIIVAAKNGGGDPEANLTLRYAVDEAKAANMPKDTIENAIKKGTGELGGQSYEAVVYEGYAPAGVAVMLELLTDNRNRTAAEIRKIFERGNGNLGTSGCVEYIFDRKGQLLVSKEGVDEETLMSAALEAGAEDMSDAEDYWEILTDPADFQTVREAVEALNVTLESASVTRIPNNTVTLTGEDVRRVMNLLENLEDHDDVQKVHTNADIPDSELANIEG